MAKSLEASNDVDLEDRRDEILALNEILNSGNFSSSCPDGLTGNLRAQVQFNSESFIATSGCQSVKLRHLPPITVEFRCPSNYPSVNPPKFSVSSLWLSHQQSTLIENKLGELFLPGNPVLYSVFSFIQEETVDFLQLNPENLEIPRLKIGKVIRIIPEKYFMIKYENETYFSWWHQGVKAEDVVEFASEPFRRGKEKVRERATHVAVLPNGVADTEMPNRKILRSLVQFNEAAIESQFKKQCFSCIVCFQDKLGKYCISFPNCHHVYCDKCMKEYFEIKIKDGSVNNLLCPNDGCPNAALPHQVKKLVSPDLYKLYENKLLEITLETMADVMLCPLKHCQVPTLIDRKVALGECPGCQFVFCTYCKLTYHGVEPCKLLSQEYQLLLKTYQEGDEEEKIKLEQRYGKKQLTEMLNHHLSLDYLKENTKKCPKCRTPISKIGGCNKMTCNHCGTNFCYLCGARISSENPYDHFNVAGTECNNALFEGVYDEEEEEEPNQFWFQDQGVFDHHDEDEIDEMFLDELIMEIEFR